METDVVHNPDQARYEVWADDKLAGFVQYRPREGALNLFHTEIDGAYDGQGLGSRSPAARSTTCERSTWRSCGAARSSRATSAATRSTRTAWRPARAPAERTGRAQRAAGRRWRST